MKMEITFSHFCDMFNQAGRSHHFSYEGKWALFNYLEEVYDGEYSLDVIELCCTFIEDSLESALEDNNLDSIEDLESETIVIYVSDDVVIYEDY